MFIRCRCVHSGAPGEFRFMRGRCRVCSGVRWVHPGRLGSLWCANGVIGFILGRWVHSGAPWVSLGSSRVALGYARGGWVHPVSLESLGSALGVGGFIRNRCVHSDTPWGLLGSSGVVWFTRERPVGRWVHAGSLGSSGVAFVHALGVVGFIRCCWVHSGAP